MVRETSLSIEAGNESSKFDDDGRLKRTGTLLTATAHIITVVIGSGVLSLAWTMAQLGWIAGPIALVAFSVITWFTSILLVDGYRSSNGTRNYTYKDVVRSHLGGIKVQLCAIAQYSILVGASIGYSITASISLVAIKRSICFHKIGHSNKDNCHMPNNPYIISFGVLQIILSQIPNFHKLSILSIIAAAMSFAYSTIGVGLSIGKIAEGGNLESGLTGIPIGPNMPKMEKMWNTYSALGNIAFAYAFSNVLVEIQDTIQLGAESESKVMKKATLAGISVSTVFYMLCGILGYAAFGNNAPGNMLTGFGFYEPFWLVGLANLFIVIHLVGAYQVLSQPIFGVVEDWIKEKWPKNKFLTGEYSIFKLSLFRLTWRTSYVIFTTTLAMLFPFFNDFVGLIGAITFWPLTVYFPIEIYLARSKIPRFSFKWIWMRSLSGICLVVSLLAAAGSIEGLVKSLGMFKPFHSVS
ncbi:hypothetical protein ABFS83_14G101400 [Erythranthe nasuta]